MSENLTSSLINQLFKKVIEEVYMELIMFGFKKKGSLDLSRIDNSMYQKLNFQRHTHQPLMTVNVTFRPFFLDSTDDSVLQSNKRIGLFEFDYDKWFEIQDDYKETSTKIIKLIIDKVLPYYEGLNTPKKVLENLDQLDSEEYYKHSQLILFSALKEHNIEISLKYLDSTIGYLLNDKKTIESINGDVSGIKDRLEYYKGLQFMVHQNNFNEIDVLLTKFQDEFLKKFKK